MAFELADMPGLNFDLHPKNKILYLRRQDKEFNQIFSSDLSNNNNLVMEDWISYKYKWLLEDVVEEWVERRYQISLGKFESFLIRSLTKLYREGWQRGLTRPREWFSRYQWESNHPYSKTFELLYNSQMYRLSLSLIHSAIYQFSQYNLIITNRLHGHILCILLEIPHIFLPNSYYKNEASYQTWTKKVPFCRFVKDIAQIQGTLTELIN